MGGEGGRGTLWSTAAGVLDGGWAGGALISEYWVLNPFVRESGPDNQGQYAVIRGACRAGRGW